MNKRQRLGTWYGSAILLFVLAALLDVPAELYIPNSWFQRIASITLASAAVMLILATGLAFISLAWSDYQESKITSNFVNLDENDHIIAVHKINNTVVHLPVSGITQQAILAPNGSKLPHVSRGPLEHIHVLAHLPTIEPIGDELYEKLFGVGHLGKGKNNGNHS